MLDWLCDWLFPNKCEPQNDDDSRDRSTLTFRFLTAYSWKNSAQIVLENPAMLRDDSVFAIFAYKIAKAKIEGNECSARILDDNFEFLVSCKNRGVRSALEYQVQQYGGRKLLQQAHSENLHEAMQKLPEIAAKVQESPAQAHMCIEEAFARCPELISAEFDSLIELLIKQSSAVDEGTYALLDLRRGMAQMRISEAYRLGGALARERDWGRAEIAFQVASSAVDLMYWLEPIRATRHALAKVGSEIAVDAAVAFAKRGMYGATVWIERGRARMFRDRENRTRIVEGRNRSISP